MNYRTTTLICNEDNRVFPLLGSEFAPSNALPVRCVFRLHAANTKVTCHRHAWDQMIFSDRGVVRVTTTRATYTVPPWRAVWIPAGVSHSAALLETAHLCSLQLLPGCMERVPEKCVDLSPWLGCRVIEVRPLLRELVKALAMENIEDISARRYESYCSLILLEIIGAPACPLMVPLPSERRLRSFCDSFMKQPSLARSLDEMAREAGASVSTINRLFHTELGSRFSVWRKQALLAHALALSAQGMTLGEISYRLGYGNQSAFSAMVRQVMGVSPSEVFAVK